MQLHVERKGSLSSFSSVRRRGPMTPVKRFRSTTFSAPVTAPGTRPVAGTWRAVSRAADGEPDGMWEYHRTEGAPVGLRWTATYAATGQFRLFGSLDDAREATAGPLLDDLRGEAFTFAFNSTGTDERLRGQRWIAVHMRIHALTHGTTIDVATTCSCGGLLTVALKDGRYAHVDACGQCQATLPVPCPAASTHVFCGRPDPQLTELEERMLRFETQRWNQPGRKITAIREQFAMTDVRFYATLNKVIEKPAAVRAFPLLVRRLRSLRDSRARK